MSKKAGIRELKNQASRIVNEVREEMAEYVITSQGTPVAVLRPFSDDDAALIRRRQAEQTLVEMKSLAEEIGRCWKAPKSARQLLDEDRR